MKAEINSTNKAKFFGLYWGQRVISYNDEFGGLRKVDGSHLFNSEVCLKLKPLSKISDEDGLKFYKIVHPMGWINKEPKYIRTWLNSFYDGGYEKLPTLAVDFLRSIGVAYEWMGLSVEELVKAGWIKLIS